MTIRESYLYVHRRLDNNQVFYVGIGKTKNFRRAYIKEGRNNLWKKIVSKTNYVVDIVYKNLTKEDACKKEINLIALYGRIDLKTGTLANLTDGGELNLGYKRTEEQKRKQSEKLQGSLNCRYGVKLSEETKIKMSKSSIGKKMSLEARQKISNSLVGKPSRHRRKVICLLTGTIYDSVELAAKSIEMKRTTLTMQLKNKNTNRTNLKYL